MHINKKIHLYANFKSMHVINAHTNSLATNIFILSYYKQMLKVWDCFFFCSALHFTSTLKVHPSSEMQIVDCLVHIPLLFEAAVSGDGGMGSRSSLGLGVCGAARAVCVTNSGRHVQLWAGAEPGAAHRAEELSTGPISGGGWDARSWWRRPGRNAPAPQGTESSLVKERQETALV